MIINAETKIGAIIKDNPQAIEVLISINQHFKKLRNPLLRKILAPRVTVAEAATIGNCKVETILNGLGQIGFEIKSSPINAEETPSNTSAIYNEPDLAASIDVRPDLANGVDPFKNIMDKLSEIAPGNTLLVINSFEPAPLIRILKGKGYHISVISKEPGIVFTYITKTVENGVLKADVKEPSENQDLFEDVLRQYNQKFTEIDVRKMEMPKPMIAILDELDRLKSGKALYVRHKKIPLFLFPELKERHFNYVLKQAETEVILIIYNQA